MQPIKVKIDQPHQQQDLASARGPSINRSLQPANEIISTKFQAFATWLVSRGIGVGTGIEIGRVAELIRDYNHENKNPAQQITVRNKASLERIAQNGVTLTSKEIIALSNGALSVAKDRSGSYYAKDQSENPTSKMPREIAPIVHDLRHAIRSVSQMIRVDTNHLGSNQAPLERAGYNQIIENNQRLLGRLQRLNYFAVRNINEISNLDREIDKLIKSGDLSLLKSKSEEKTKLMENTASVIAEKLKKEFGPQAKNRSNLERASLLVPNELEQDKRAITFDAASEGARRVRDMAPQAAAATTLALTKNPTLASGAQLGIGSLANGATAATQIALGESKEQVGRQLAIDEGKVALNAFATRVAGIGIGNPAQLSIRQVLLTQGASGLVSGALNGAAEHNPITEPHQVAASAVLSAALNMVLVGSGALAGNLLREIKDSSGGASILKVNTPKVIETLLDRLRSLPAEVRERVLSRSVDPDVLQSNKLAEALVGRALERLKENPMLYGHITRQLEALKDPRYATWAKENGVSLSVIQTAIAASDVTKVDPKLTAQLLRGKKDLMGVQLAPQEAEIAGLVNLLLHSRAGREWLKTELPAIASQQGIDRRVVERLSAAAGRAIEGHDSFRVGFGTEMLRPLLSKQLQIPAGLIQYPKSQTLAGFIVQALDRIEATDPNTLIRYTTEATQRNLPIDKAVESGILKNYTWLEKTYQKLVRDARKQLSAKDLEAFMESPAIKDFEAGLERYRKDILQVFRGPDGQFHKVNGVYHVRVNGAFKPITNLDEFRDNFSSALRGAGMSVD